MREFILFAIILTSVLGQDPWDGSKLNKVPLQCSDHSDVFYKRILNFLIHRAYYTENIRSEIIDIELFFSLTKQERAVLERYAGLPVSLTPSELREIDGILSNRISEPSAIYKLQRQVGGKFSTFCAKYYLETLVSVAIAVCIYQLKYINWSRIYTSRGLFILSVFIIILWECYVIYQEIEKEALEELLKRNTPATWGTYFTLFWGKEPSVAKISTPWEDFHPYTIMTRIFSRLLYKPTMALFTMFDSLTKHLTGTLTWPLNIIVHTGLVCLYLFGTMMFFYAMIMYILFKTPFNMSFLGLGIDVKNREKNTTRLNREELPSADQNEKLINILENVSNVMAAQITTKNNAIKYHSDVKSEDKCNYSKKSESEILENTESTSCSSSTSRNKSNGSVKTSFKVNVLRRRKRTYTL